MIEGEEERKEEEREEELKIFVYAPEKEVEEKPEKLEEVEAVVLPQSLKPTATLGPLQVQVHSALKVDNNFKFPTEWPKDHKKLNLLVESAKDIPTVVTYLRKFIEGKKPFTKAHGSGSLFNGLSRILTRNNGHLQSSNSASSSSESPRQRRMRETGILFKRVVNWFIAIEKNPVLEILKTAISDESSPGQIIELLKKFHARQTPFNEINSGCVVNFDNAVNEILKYWRDNNAFFPIEMYPSGVIATCAISLKAYYIGYYSSEKITVQEEKKIKSQECTEEEKQQIKSDKLTDIEVSLIRVFETYVNYTKKFSLVDPDPYLNRKSLLHRLNQCKKTFLESGKTNFIFFWLLKKISGIFPNLNLIDKDFTELDREEKVQYLRLLLEEPIFCELRSDIISAQSKEALEAMLDTIFNNFDKFNNAKFIDAIKNFQGDQESSGINPLKTSMLDNDFVHRSVAIIHLNTHLETNLRKSTKNPDEFTLLIYLITKTVTPYIKEKTPENTAKFNKRKLVAIRKQIKILLEAETQERRKNVKQLTEQLRETKKRARRVAAKEQKEQDARKKMASSPEKQKKISEMIRFVVTTTMWMNSPYLEPSSYEADLSGLYHNVATNRDADSIIGFLEKYIEATEPLSGKAGKKHDSHADLRKAFKEIIELYKYRKLIYSRQTLPQYDIEACNYLIKVYPIFREDKKIADDFIKQFGNIIEFNLKNPDHYFSREVHHNNIDKWLKSPLAATLFWRMLDRLRTAYPSPMTFCKETFASSNLNKAQKLRLVEYLLSDPIISKWVITKRILLAQDPRSLAEMLALILKHEKFTLIFKQGSRENTLKKLLCTYEQGNKISVFKESASKLYKIISAENYAMIKEKKLSLIIFITHIFNVQQQKLEKLKKKQGEQKNKKENSHKELEIKDERSITKQLSDPIEEALEKHRKDCVIELNRIIPKVEEEAARMAAANRTASAGTRIKRTVQEGTRRVRQSIIFNPDTIQELLKKEGEREKERQHPRKSSSHRASPRDPNHITVKEKILYTTPFADLPPRSQQDFIAGLENEKIEPLTRLIILAQPNESLSQMKICINQYFPNLKQTLLPIIESKIGAGDSVERTERAMEKLKEKLEQASNNSANNTHAKTTLPLRKRTSLCTETFGGLDERKKEAFIQLLKTDSFVIELRDKIFSVQPTTSQKDIIEYLKNEDVSKNILSLQKQMLALLQRMVLSTQDLKSLESIVKYLESRPEFSIKHKSFMGLTREYIATYKERKEQETRQRILENPEYKENSPFSNSFIISPCLKGFSSLNYDKEKSQLLEFITNIENIDLLKLESVLPQSKNPHVTKSLWSLFFLLSKVSRGKENTQKEDSQSVEYDTYIRAASRISPYVSQHNKPKELIEKIKKTITELVIIHPLIKQFEVIYNKPKPTEKGAKIKYANEHRKNLEFLRNIFEKEDESRTEKISSRSTGSKRFSTKPKKERTFTQERDLWRDTVYFNKSARPLLSRSKNGNTNHKTPQTSGTKTKGIVEVKVVSSSGWTHREESQDTLPLRHNPDDAHTGKTQTTLSLQPLAFTSTFDTSRPRRKGSKPLPKPVKKAESKNPPNKLGPSRWVSRRWSVRPRGDSFLSKQNRETGKQPTTSNKSSNTTTTATTKEQKQQRRRSQTFGSRPQPTATAGSGKSSKIAPTWRNRNGRTQKTSQQSQAEPAKTDTNDQKNLPTQRKRENTAIRRAKQRALPPTPKTQPTGVKNTQQQTGEQKTTGGTTFSPSKGPGM